LRDSADIVWPLDDINPTASISKAINFFNKNENSYSASINVNNTSVVYNPIVFGGGTCLSFTSSAVGMSIPAIDRFSELYNYRQSSMSFWFQSSQLFAQEYPIFKRRGSDNIGLFIKDNYLIFRYGPSASYRESVMDIVDPTEPHHIFVYSGVSGLFLTVDGMESSNSLNNILLPADLNHDENNYIDFYGPPSGEWVIDSVSLYPNFLDSGALKRHYVYGLGKNVGDEVFYSRGGSLYNFSTINTQRIFSTNWRTPRRWKLKDLYHLDNDIDGIKPVRVTNPTVYSFNDTISYENNTISFNSSSSVPGSYIEFDDLPFKIQSGEYPFLVKVKLDGILPEKYLSQRIMSYGEVPQNEIVKFDLFNNNGSYEVRVFSYADSSSVSFSIQNTESNPSIYVGMKFSGQSRIYFCQESASIQSFNFPYNQTDEFALDPLVSYFPPPANSVIRIGSSLNYDDTNFTVNVSGVSQFLGTFEKFLVIQDDFDGNFDYSYLENYNKVRYQASYDSSLKRFKIKTYGRGEFNLHSIQFSNYEDDDFITVGSNRVKIGYPMVESSSQVLFHTTLLDYSGSVSHPRTRITDDNNLSFLNNTNLINKYLNFDFEIYSEDTLHYPPKIKYFSMETFKGSDSKTVFRDPAGVSYILYSSASSNILPDQRQTPTIYLKNNSGVNLIKSVVDMSENILPKPLDLRTLDGLILWMDSRFVGGFDKINPSDDQHIFEWSDLSQENNNFYESPVLDEPVFRIQSKNLLKVNQANGSEDGDLSNIITNNSSTQSSPDGAIGGFRGIKVIPDGTSTDSYINVLSNNADITLYPNQKYIFLGSLKLSKPQTSSALHELSRGIGIFTSDGNSTVLSASSSIAPNSPGIYSLSVTFTTASNVISGEIRLYNGSPLESDFVYWDNLGLYPTTSSYVEWQPPLIENDRHSIMFNGKEMMTASISLPNSFSLYAVVRSFGDGHIISNSENILYIDSGSYTFSTGTPFPFYENSGEFIYTSIICDNGSSSFYVNRNFLGSSNTGVNSLTINQIGDQFKGDISSLVIYSQVHNEYNRTLIEDWIEESFF
jgi:hypothetical protein